jgi:phosphoribosylformimino-5-aminoimidazole carboxamide ribotide isomerase
MRLIPVLDLKNGIAVHAVRGERQTYQPVTSVLSPDANAESVAAGFRDQFGFTELYVADLDAILGQGNQHELIRSLARHSGLDLIVDAGVAEVEGVRQILDLGVKKVIIGAETLTNWEAATMVLDTFPQEKLVFSLDMRAGKVLSAYKPLSAMQPLEAVDKLFQAGWREIILLDLARVGAQSGIDWELLGKARRAFPDLTLLVGGGVRDVNDLVELRSTGMDGALIATMIHRGVLTRQQLRSFGFVGG